MVIAPWLQAVFGIGSPRSSSREPNSYLNAVYTKAASATKNIKSPFHLYPRVFEFLAYAIVVASACKHGAPGRDIPQGCILHRRSQEERE